MYKKNIIINTIKGINKVLPEKFQKRALAVLILSLLNSILELIGLASLIPLFSVIFQEKVIEKNNIISSIYHTVGFTSENQFILSFIGLIIFIIVLKNIISLFVIRYQAKFSFDIMEYLMLQLHRLFYNKGFLFFKKNNSNTIYRDIYLVPQYFARSVLMGSINLLNEMIVLFLIVIAIAWYDIVILVLLVCTVVPIFFLFYFLTKQKIKRLGEETNKVMPLISADIFQSSFGYVDVVITSTYEFFYNRINKNITKFKQQNIDRTTLNYIPTKLIESTMVFAIFVISLYGLYFLPNKESLLALLGVFAISAYRVMPSINRIMIAMNGLIENQYTFDVINQLDSTNVMPMHEESILFEKEIKIENISFNYPGTKKVVLNKFNLNIKKGEILGIMGKSGSGKTTLMNILLGFLNPTSGRIRIDDQELNESTLNSWQRKIGYVQQEVFLLDTTLAENIAFGLKKKEINYNKLQYVIELSSLSELVESLPSEVDTIVGERGSELSGGQRQRIGIARALYFDSEILFFDEATSALDTQTEKDINESINNLSHQGLTMIIIAHRESSLINADRVIKL